MRVSDSLKSSVCFLAVKLRDGSYEYAGTAFVVSVPSDTHSSLSHFYLVTAKHCIEDAKAYPSLHVRLNFFPHKWDIGDREADYIEVPSDDWIFPRDEAIDIALRPFGLPQDTINYLAIPHEMFADHEKMKSCDVGIGDDVFTMGLFTQHGGRTKNLPIVRSGIIAAMPEEPLEDVKSGKPYDAFLMEIHSIGGLSGTPVFLTANRGLPESSASAGKKQPFF